jgi:hypothetical protein
VTRKLILIRTFIVHAEPSRIASSIATPWGYKDGGCSDATYILPHDLPPSPASFPMAEKKER